MKSCDHYACYSRGQQSCTNDPVIIHFRIGGSLATPARVGAADVALDGHVGQPGPALAKLAGRPAPTAQVPTLAEATVAVELVGVTAMVSGHMRLWRDHTDHPRPPCRYWLA